MNSEHLTYLLYAIMAIYLAIVIPIWFEEVAETLSRLAEAYLVIELNKVPKPH